MNEKINKLSEDMQKTIVNATANIANGYFSNNKTDTTEISPIVENIYKTLVSITSKTSSYSIDPFISPDKSITPDFIICLEDGKKLKMLKRYIKSKYNMTEKEYKEKWGLPRDYPMIAPNYAKKRSELAKNSGLGKDKK